MIEAAVILSAVAQHWPDLTIILLLLLANAVLEFWEEHLAACAVQGWLKAVREIRKDEPSKQNDANRATFL
jgi:H+-transporting ATPase